MTSNLVDKIEPNLKWFVLEIDLRENENPEKDMSQITLLIDQESNYDPYLIYESKSHKGLYHIHCRRKKDA